MLKECCNYKVFYGKNPFACGRPLTVAQDHLQHVPSLRVRTVSKRTCEIAHV